MSLLTVCITGPDGSGKSTQVDALAERLRLAGDRVAVSTIWDPLADPRFAGHRLFAGKPEADAYLALLRPPARMHLLCHALHESLELARAREPEVLVLNAYWYKYLAAEVAHGGDRSMLEQIVSALPAPELTLFLRVSVDEASRRKDGDFTGYETGFASPRGAAAFTAFQRVAGAEIDRLATELGWVELDGHAPVDEVGDRILTAVHAARR